MVFSVQMWERDTNLFLVQKILFIFQIDLRLTLYFIKDVTDNNGLIMDYNCLKSLANINLLEYYQVRLLINNYVKWFNYKPIKTPVYLTIPPHIQLLFKSRKRNRDYLIPLQSQSEKPTCILKWHEKLKNILNKQTWRTIVHIAHITINDNYYKWFQLRLIHGILGVNNYLHKMSISKTQHVEYVNNIRKHLVIYS